MPRVAPPDRREHILAAARAEFAAKGFAAARMDDIARRVGISKAALYLQFESKEALFRALVEELIGEMLPAFVPEDLSGIEAAGLLRGLVTAGLDRLASPAMAFVPRLIIGEGSNFPELAKYYHDKAISRIMGMIERVICHGVARGEFLCPNPELASRSVAGGIVLSALWKIVFEPVGGRPLDIRAMGQSHADILLNGLLVREEAMS